MRRIESGQNGHSPDFVVADKNGLQSSKHGESLELLNLVVGEIDSVKLILEEKLVTKLKHQTVDNIEKMLKFCIITISPTNVAPRFSITAILFPTLRQERKSDCTIHIHNTTSQAL